MIKTVIQKIIVNSFGQFIKGIQKDKLSVDLFGGNFKLQNISLNHEYFDSLNTPFKLAYSSIGKLNITAYLSKLSSVPVECVLDNIYVILEFRPEVSKQTKQEILENQKRSIKKYLEEIFKNYMQKIKDEKKEDGMMSKLGKKIIDNLQMKIVNVHVRFQQNRGNLKYGWGLTLEEINLITANNEWQPTFVDREKQGSFNDKLYKKMNVKNLSLYWQTPSNEMEAKQIIIKEYPNDNDKKQKLLQMIHSNKNSIISITSQFKLIMNNPLDQKIPLYELDISLQPIKFQLDRIQVIQMIDFIHKNVVQNEMILRTLKQKKKQKPSSQIQLQKLKQQFIDYVDIIIQSQHQNTKKSSDLQIYEAENKNVIGNIFNYIQMQELMQLSINPVKRIIRKVRQQELKKKKRGWFGSADTQLDEKQLDELQKFVQTTFQEDETKKRSQSALFFCINSDIAGGNFKFIDRKSNPQENQTIQFEIGQINFSISKSSDPSFMEISFSVQQIALSLVLPQMIQHKYVQRRMQILKNETKINSSTHILSPAHQKFISLVYKKQSFYPSNAQAIPRVETTVFVEMQRLIFIYKKLYFKKFKQFFTFKNFNDYMKSTTLQKFQNLKQKEKTIVENEKDSLAKIDNNFSIRVNAIAPKIICPLNEKQCWCFSLGDLKVESQNVDDRSIYPLRINSAYLRYYDDFERCMNSLENSNQPVSSSSLEESQKGIFSVINDMNFSVIYSSNKKLKTTSTQIVLPQFQLNFSRTQYENLLTIQNIFTLDTDEKQTIIEHLKKTRLQIEQQKIHQGFLNVKDENLGTWKSFYGILSGDFIYLYENRKELKQTFKISVKNCSTSILTKDGQSTFTKSNLSTSQQPKRQFLLELISSQQLCHFSCEKLQQLQKWQDEITKKANEFKTINQLMQFYEQSDERSGSISSKHSRTKSNVDSTLVRVKKNILSIKIQKIGFRYQDFEKVSSSFFSNQQDMKKIVTLMNFQIHKVEVQRIEQENFSTFTLLMSQMKIIDQVFRYKDPKFQTFLMLTNFMLKQEKYKPRTNSFQKIKQKNEKEKVSSIPIKNYITIEDLKINWKPDVILIALELINKHISKQQKYRMDDETNKTRQDHFNEVFQDTKYMFGMSEYEKKASGKKVKEKRLKLSRVNKYIKELLNLEIRINHAQAFFIHRESHLIMFRLVGEQILTQYVLGEHEKFISGSLGNVVLQQMTNYPRKNYSHGDQLESFCFAKKKSHLKSGQSQQKPVLSFFYSSYQPSVLPNEQKVDSFMYLSLQPIELIYFQQVIFRLIDYSLIQIMLLINQPQMLTVNENLMQQLRRNEEQEIKQKPVKILFSKYEQIIKKLINPYFMDIYIEVKQPQIIIKAEKNSDHFYRANLESIVIQNRDMKTDKRFYNCKFKEANKYIFEEEYLIRCNHLVFEAVDKMLSSQNEVTQKRYKLFDPVELQLVFNKLLLEDQLNIIYPQLGSSEQNEYDRSFVTNSRMSNIIIPTCSRFQYLSLNKMMNFNFTFDDQCDESFIHNFKVTKLLLPKPIIFTLEVNKIEFNADYQITQNNDNMKLFTAEIRDFKFQYLRKKDLNSQMSIKFGDTNIIGYRYESKSQGSKQKLMIHQENLINLTNKKNPYNVWSSQIEINSKTCGEKVIQMTVKSMDVNIKSGLLQLIFEYTLLEDWIFPVLNKVVPQMSFYASIEDLNAVLEDDPSLLFQTRQKNKIKQSLEQISKKVMNKPQNLRVLKLCGILCYKFHRKKTFSNAHFKELLETKQMSQEQFQHLPEQTYMSVIVNTQLYHCYKNTNKKRKIMQKFTLNMNEKRYLKVSNLQEIIFKQAIIRSFNLDKCFFKVSVIDLLLFKDILEIMNIQRQYIDFLNNKVGKNNNQVELSIKNTDNQLNSLDSMNVSVTSLSFYLINSWKEVFIPILNFKIEELNLTSNNTFKKQIIQGDFSMMLNYFNSLIFKWQPALEKVSFSFFKQMNKAQDNKKFAGIESSSPLILNVSKEMFVSMRETMSAWKTQSQIFENRLKNSSSQSDEPIEFISHYIIRNQTGYQIEIYCDHKLKYKISNNSQVDHEMELQEYEEETQRDVIIAFRILHPSLKFKTIGNVSVNAQKQYLIKPKLTDGNEIDAEILIKPINENSKQVLLIGSNKKVNQYFDNYCKTTILCFDSPPQVRINHIIYGEKTANLYKVKQNKIYKFIGQNGILTIMPKYLVFNYTPIPLKINDKILRPNQYLGVYEKPLINGQKIKDTILRVQLNQKQGHIYIYCDAYIVDYYGLYFDFGSSDQGKLIKKLYAGQGQKNGYKYFIYVLPEAQYKFRVKINEKSKEHQTLKSAIGRLAFSLKKGSAQCDFSAFCYLNSYKNQHLKQFNRVIEITPTYVLSNTTKDVLKICQKDSLTSMTLKPHERCPFFWQNADRPKEIKIALCKDNQMWGYSGALDVKKSCETFVLRNNLDRTLYRILSIHVQQTNTITFIHIFEAPSKYKIANQIKGSLITVYQSCLSQIQAQNEFMSPYQCVFNVKYGQEKQFGYELPLQKHDLTIQVELDNNIPRFKNKIAQPIMIEDIESSLYVKKVPLLNQKTKKQEGALTLVLEFEGNIKKLKLVEEQKEINNEIDYEYSIKLLSFGVSLIGMHDEFRREIVFLLLEGIDLRLTGNADIEGYELIVENLRVQNQLKHNVAFPTIIESYKTRQANFFLQFLLNRDAKNSKFIRSIGLAINRTIITVTSQQLQALQQNLQEIFSIKINLQKEQEKQMIRQYELFKKQEQINVEQSYYFEEAEIQPLKMILTFKHVNNWGGRLLKTFSSMNESMISVDGKKMRHFNAPNIGIFLKSVEESYKDQIFKTILPLIGNLSILGSPVSLVQKIGSGFKDLIQLPAQEFQNGPLGIGKGIAKGTRSLVKNTFQGAMNTVESFTGSLGNGLTALVDDQQFQKKREKIKNERTEHVGQGLKHGAKSIFNGFSKGITGLITQPVKGAEKDGLPGFFLGGLKGITGLVIKPVSGIIDATTKTAQGIKNTANFLSPSERQKRLKRLHKPRPFYSHCRQFRTYDSYLAELSDFLQKYGNAKGPFGWVGYFNLKSNQKKMPIVLLSYEYLVFLDFKRRQIVRQYRSQDLVQAVRQDNFRFRLVIKDKKMQYKDGHIDLQTEAPNHRIIKEINKLVKFYRPKFTFE